MVNFTALSGSQLGNQGKIDPAYAELLKTKQGQKDQGLQSLLGAISPSMIGQAVDYLGSGSGEKGAGNIDGIDKNVLPSNNNDLVSAGMKKKNGFGAETGEVVGGALGGAQLGAAFGPVGIGIGALLGGLGGFFG